MLGDRRLWLILTLACAVIGIAAVRLQFTLSPIQFSDPDHSARAIATQHLLTTNGFEHLESALASLPPQQPVIFMGPARQWASTEIYFLSSYISWPRKVWFVAIDDPKERPPVPLPDSSESAFIFFDVKPPEPVPPGAQSVGPRLTVLPHLGSPR